MKISLLDYTESLTIVGCDDATIKCGPAKGVCKVTICEDVCSLWREVTDDIRACPHLQQFSEINSSLRDLPRSNS